jgi:hypothetical protein
VDTVTTAAAAAGATTVRSRSKEPKVSWVDRWPAYRRPVSAGTAGGGGNGVDGRSR